MRNQTRSRTRVHVEGQGTRGNVQTTLRLPERLYAQAKAFVEGQASGSVNELIVNALTAYLRAVERRAIDDAFKPMAVDAAYHREALKIAREFAASDAEAIVLSDCDLAGL
jgi:hypothetical protein